MSFKDEWKLFHGTYSYRECEVNGAVFHYVWENPTEKPTLVFLNGGTNVSGMWMHYLEELCHEFGVLLFDYPMECRTNGELVSAMDGFFRALHIEKPILIGASGGGFVAQLYTQKHSENVGGLVLMATGGLDAQSIQTLGRKYFFMPLMLRYMEKCNYEKLKPKMIRTGVRHAKQENPENQAYVREMFTEVFVNYTKEKDLHATGLLADLIHQTPMTRADLEALSGKILVFFPTKDFFSPKLQKNLLDLLPEPQVEYLEGGHLSTILQADAIIEKIREFLEK